MKIAIISDVHANLEALQAFIRQKDRFGWEKIYCLGDVVGYGPNPNECIELLQEHQIKCVLGNHDAMVTESLATSRASLVAREGIAWTQANLNENSIAYLKALPRIVRDGELLFVHASIYSLEEYIRTQHRAFLELKGIRSRWPQVRIAFHGHTHQPALYDLNGASAPVLLNSPELIADGRDHTYLVNPGAIGQSRGPHPWAFFALYDRATARLSLEHVEYDYKTTAEKMAREGLRAPLYRTPMMRFKKKVRKLIAHIR